MIITITLLTSCVKLLLAPAYRSTDFEVHRNWLAITHMLPVKKWYFENTSEWTLDYPPLFAWFEYILSLFAVYFDSNMLNIKNLNYASPSTILFQRLSVIITDLIYAYGVNKCASSLTKSWRTEVVLPVLLVTNAGLLMVDHIHFQYNGIMFGILLLSIAYLLQERYMLSAFWYTVLLNMKHLFIYLAPAYFVYLLRNYCFKQHPKKIIHIIKFLNLKNLISLALIIVTVFVVTFAPFFDQIDQVLSRMFPFKRGLCHAYWAPNVWAVYNLVDKIAALVFSRYGIKFNDENVASMTGGLVQEFSHTVLPSVRPVVTMVFIALMITPALIKLWTVGSKPIYFLRCLVLCALTSFLFGWHVHEKAILMAIIPLSILSVMEVGDAKIFTFLTTVGHYSLFPLLFPKSLLLIKVLLLLLHSTYAFYSLSNMYPLHICKYTLPLLNPIESLYILGLVPLFLYENVIHHLLGLSGSLPFLPLMMTSVYCSLGVMYSWLKCYLYFLNHSEKNVKSNKIK